MSPEKRTFKITRRHRQILAMSSAAAILVVGLGAFGMLPQVRELKVANDQPLQFAQATPRATPRVVSPATPFSFADLVERVRPAVVTITSEGVTRTPSLEDIPAPFRDFFDRFGRGQQQQQPRRA